MKTTLTKIIWAFLAVVLAVSACVIPTSTPVKTPLSTAIPTIAPTSQPVPEGIYPPAFATYEKVAARLPQIFQGGGYTLPVDLDQVSNLSAFTLTDNQRLLMEQNGFVVTAPIPGRYREFYQVYESGRYNEQPMFVTTDSVYHIYHLIFDKMLRDLETDFFISTLNSLTSSMLQATYQQYQSLLGTPLEEPALRNVAFFAVAARLLDLPDAVPPEALSLVDAELVLINAASGETISPIWDRPDLQPDMKLIEVYGQYKPRGHYTRSETLERYFRAMMWYGRLTYRLNDDFETRRALLVTQALRSTVASDGTPALDLWKKVYDPTVFIVGKADDLGVYEYGALSDQVFGTNPQPASFADETLFAAFKKAAENLPPPQVNSMWVWIWQDQEQVTKGFRFMGQRFTLDSYVFGQLIWRKVGTLADPRGLPKGLDFFASLGSDEALSILDEMGETHYENFSSQMDKVKSEVSALGEDSWTQNIYWSWLYSFFPLIQEKGTAFPEFMRTQAWMRKDLQTALGSWTELKHDTILYAKQVMAEMGGGGPEQPPHGYVEPNPEAYARLLALSRMTFSGLEARGLLSDLTRTNLENLISELEFLQSVSERELAGEPLSTDEYWHIQYWGGTLEQFTLAAADTTDQFSRDLSDQKAALVADVATGLGEGGAIVALEEAVGIPAMILVVLPDSPWRVGLGAVYTYYEFTVSSSARMTDEEWQAQVEAGTNPPQPEWTGTFISK